MNIIDITQEMFSCNVYPGDRHPAYERVKSFPADSHQLTTFSLSAHNGTHADAPLHFVPEGQAIDALDLHLFYGPCLVADCPNTAAVLAACRNEERLLLKGVSELTPVVARAIVEAGVKLLGVEGQSVAPEDAPEEVHRILLAAGVVILEGLVLAQARPGRYTLAAFPLRLGGCEGSPVRAVLIEE